MCRPISTLILVCALLPAVMAGPVNAAEASLANLSSRGQVGTGDNIIIAGFAINGASKRVLVRAVGPGLTQFGVSGVLADPVLSLFDSSSAVIGTNDDWNAAEASVFTQVGAFSITSGSKDAALDLTLAPGSYSAQVSGKAGTTGIAIVEVYDVDGVARGSHLINLSARAVVGTGDAVLIPGIVIADGSGIRRLLVRAAGPALAPLHVGGYLTDPTMSVFDSQGVLVAGNDNWGTNDVASITAMASQAGAFPFPDTNSKDSALLLDLNPGSYTVQVSGVSHSTGVALVEVYDVTPTGNAGTVSIAATDSAASTAGNDPGVFTVTRTGDTSQALIVTYSTDGTAFNIIDYVYLDGTVTIPAGQSSATIVVTPVPSVENKPVRQAIVTLQPGSGYTLGGATSSSVDITSVPATLYVASLRTEPGASTSTAFGTATILLSASGTIASVNIAVSNLSSLQTTAYLRLGPPGQDGAYIRSLPLGSSEGNVWQLDPTGIYSSADLLSALQGGLLYLGIDTANFPSGELRGTFILASGSQVFTPPPDAPAAETAPVDAGDAARFLTQATFGPATPDIDALLTETFSQWIDQQMAKPPSSHRTATMADFAANNAGGQLPDANGVNTRPGGVHRQAAWWKIALTGDDQLRQRVAFALSEIFVISDVNSTVNNQQEGAANYYDILVNDAFGNFRTLLEDVTLSPMMGVYLSHLRNAKANTTTGAQPDENYAREVMQLFSIGLVQLQPDGTLKLDPSGLPIPTYNQTTITETAKVFTGWAFHNAVINDTNFRRGAADYIDPMSLYPTEHEDRAKTIVGGVVIPAGQGGAADLDDALDTFFNHPNTAAFFARHLIQRLVTSNPSPAYVYRVAQVFADNGSGVRGDLGAVVRAILLDYEARSSAVAGNAGYGKLKEPILRLTALLRAFHASNAANRFAIANPQNNLDQAALRSPTVFNFFEPDYVQPGILANAGLHAPEYEIVTDSTAISIPNYLYSFTFNSSNNVTIDLSELLPLVGTPDALVDKVSLLLANGSLSASAHDRVVAALKALPGSTSNNDRVHTAIYLVINSPDAAAQR